MFDLGFWELALIMVVALLVIGPERLPPLVRTLGRWVGRARAFMQTVKQDINRELAAEELQRVLKQQQSELSDLREIVEETRAGAEPAVKAVRETAEEARRSGISPETGELEAPGAAGDEHAAKDRPTDADRPAGDAAGGKRDDDASKPGT